MALLVLQYGAEMHLLWGTREEGGLTSEEAEAGCRARQHAGVGAARVLHMRCCSARSVQRCWHAKQMLARASHIAELLRLSIGSGMKTRTGMRGTVWALVVACVAFQALRLRTQRAPRFEQVDEDLFRRAVRDWTEGPVLPPPPLAARCRHSPRSRIAPLQPHPVVAAHSRPAVHPHLGVSCAPGGQVGAGGCGGAGHASPPSRSAAAGGAP